MRVNDRRSGRIVLPLEVSARRPAHRPGIIFQRLSVRQAAHMAAALSRRRGWHSTARVFCSFVAGLDTIIRFSKRMRRSPKSTPEHRTPLSLCLRQPLPGFAVAPCFEPFRDGKDCLAPPLLIAAETQALATSPWYPFPRSSLHSFSRNVQPLIPLRMCSPLDANLSRPDHYTRITTGLSDRPHEFPRKLL